MIHPLQTAIAAALIALVQPWGPTAKAGGFFEDFFEPYLQRVEGVTKGAGNASAFNAATHTIDPWPRNVTNRRIPANGERMSGAVERYRDVRRQPFGPTPLSPTVIGPSGPSSPAASPAAVSPITP